MLIVMIWVIAGAAGVGVCQGAPKEAEARTFETKDVGAEMRRLIKADYIEQDRLFSLGLLEAYEPQPPRRKGTRGVAPPDITTAQDAAGGCDGIKNGHWGFHTASGEKDAWWQVDLGKSVTLDRIVVYNRMDHGGTPEARRLRIFVAEDAKGSDFSKIYEHANKPFGGVGKLGPLVVDLKGKDCVARVVRLLVPGRCSFALDEIEVYAADDPKRNIALNRPADQKSVGPYSFPGTMGRRELIHIYGEAPNTDVFPVHPRFSFAHTQTVLRRARKLADRLDSPKTRARLAPLTKKLDALSERLTTLEAASPKPGESARKKLYLDARRLAREIAFVNPLLDIDKLLFVKRHDPKGVYHMCDQYYGFNAVPGGGVFVLRDPFGSNPKLVNLLKGAVVERGRLKGKPLTPGAFVSPEPDFDAEWVYFAYTEAKGKDLEWSPRASYHIFKVRTDGTGLVQLTDGPADDFDPCVLPNGRIAFITERRGGYLRCGRHCPTYTMFSMKPDGSDIICLSYHETHEWHPSVTHDGMIVYTRWDYVDRDTNVAHHIWTCYPDGRDPRSFHGNYPVHRESRPWMEMSIRAIPGSERFVATAAAHHGHAFGSLVLIDPGLPDDRAMSQLTRLTPEVPFPEAEGGKRNIRRHMVYGTPWPLSEDDHLCVYDPKAKNHGIYWIDRFGNRELVYRDPKIPCLSPIPLRPRPMPPLIPTQTTQTAASPPNGDGTETIAVMNVYDADFEWPEGTTIRRLRIVQALPKTTAPPNKPRIGIGEQTNARQVIGTVPVESDGSVHFKAPVGKAIYFQALDEEGMAVQSMRSATYVHPGEHLRCHGCHEPKDKARFQFDAMPTALRRPPSEIRPGPEGSKPFSYVRLVQPVLDRHCVACHSKEEKAPDLSGAIEGPNGWTRSYNALAGKYGFYFHVRNGSIKMGVHGGSRTVPGKFGARAAKLTDYLDERHYGVKLPPEERLRITTWLDCNSEFYGAYERTEAQARGEAVTPSLN